MKSERHKSQQTSWNTLYQPELEKNGSFRLSNFGPRLWPVVDPWTFLENALKTLKTLKFTDKDFPLSVDQTEKSCS